MLSRVFLFFCVSLILLGTANPANSLRIDQIGSMDVLGWRNTPAPDASQNIGGSLKADPASDPQADSVQAAWRFAGEQTWHVIDVRTRPEKSAHRWTFLLAGAEIGRPDDYNAQLQVVAFLTPPGQFLPPGPMDDRTLKRASLLVSQIVSVHRDALATHVAQQEAQVRMNRIGVQAVEHGPTYNVDAHEVAEIEFRTAEKLFIQVMVAPRDSNSERWVMAPAVAWHTGLAHSDVYFGQPGLNLWSEMTVYGVLLRRPLRKGKFSALEWETAIRANAVTISPAVHVRRVDHPFDSARQTRLIIDDVQSRPVDERTEWAVPALSMIEGSIEGRPIVAGEEISLFLRYNGDDSEFEYIGRAIITGDWTWQLPPVHLGKLGQRIAIIATASHGRPATPDDASVFVSSSRVHLVITADVAVRIVRVGTSNATDNQVCTAQRLSSADVELTAPALTGIEKVWIYARSPNERGSWTLLRRATQKYGRVYHMFPTVLSENGHEVVVIAVVAERPPVNLNDRELEGVIAFSDQVNVKIQ